MKSDTLVGRSFLRKENHVCIPQLWTNVCGVNPFTEQIGDVWFDRNEVIQRGGCREGDNAVCIFCKEHSPSRKVDFFVCEAGRFEKNTGDIKKI